MPSPLTLTGLVAAALVAAAPCPGVAQQTAPAPRPLTLGDAARIAAERGATSQAARERAVQHGARAYQARAELLPTFGTDALVDGGTDQTLTPGGSIPGGYWTPVSDRAIDVRLRVTQKLLDLPSLKRWQAAQADAAAEGGTAAAAAEAAAADGALAYLTVLRAEGTISARVADSTLAEELLDMARQQLTAGTAIALDVTRAESQLAGVVSQLITGRSQAARARLELLRALSLPLDAPVALTDSLRPPAADDRQVSLEAAIGVALDRRPEVHAAAAQIEVARRQTSAIKAERLPTVSAFASLASTSDELTGQRAFGFTVSVPWFDGFKREARVAEGRAREREAGVEYADARRRAEVEVRTAFLDLTAAEERVAAASVQLRLAEQEVAQARERFRNGVAGNADVISASLTLNGARDQVVDALASYHAARVALARAQGVTTTLQ